MANMKADQKDVKQKEQAHEDPEHAKKLLASLTPQRTGPYHDDVQAIVKMIKGIEEDIEECQSTHKALSRYRHLRKEIDAVLKKIPDTRENKGYIKLLTKLFNEADKKYHDYKEQWEKIQKAAKHDQT